MDECEQFVLYKDYPSGGKILLMLGLDTSGLDYEDILAIGPARFPATDKSWHGEPPVITSTGGTSHPWIFVMSPKCFMHPS